MTRLQTKKSSSLTFYAALPVHDEPTYNDGYTCDACKADFFTGPFYHCKRTGEDRCMRCSVATGLHLLPPVVTELYVPQHELVKQSAGHADGCPLVAYRCHDAMVGIVMSSNKVILVAVSHVSLIRGTVHDLATGVATEYDGADLVDTYPFVERWGNPTTLSDERLFIPVRHGSLQAPPSEAGSRPTDVLLRRLAVGNALQVFEFHSGAVQVFNHSSRIGTIWGNFGDASATASPSRTLLLSYQVGSVGMLEEKKLIESELKPALQALSRFSIVSFE